MRDGGPSLLIDVNSKSKVRRSIFDRLTEVGEELPDHLAHTCSVEELRTSVARDLERLLNSRMAWDFEAEQIGFDTVRSVFGYGVRDFVGRLLTNSEDRRFVCKSISHAIEVHESRLAGVVVEFDDKNMSSSSFRFAIRAWLIINPTKESVSFDAELHPALSKYKVTYSSFSSVLAS